MSLSNNVSVPLFLNHGNNMYDHMLPETITYCEILGLAAAD